MEHRRHLQIMVKNLTHSVSIYSALATLNDSLPSLQKQYQDLLAQFRGHSTPATLETLNSPNDESLAADFAHANSNAARKGAKLKAVRFTDSPAPSTSNANNDNAADPGDELFGPYRDDPSPGYREYEDGLTNQQIHEHHSQILEEQDEHLDRLGESISRQRELSMQIGDELDDHVAMLDDMEAVTDRHQSRLDRASRTLGKVARGAKENKQMTIIVILIIILVLLIAILK